MTQIIEHIPAPPARFYFREQRRKEDQRDAREAIAAERFYAAQATMNRARAWQDLKDRVNEMPKWAPAQDSTVRPSHRWNAERYRK